MFNCVMIWSVTITQPMKVDVRDRHGEWGHNMPTEYLIEYCMLPGSGEYDVLNMPR